MVSCIGYLLIRTYIQVSVIAASGIAGVYGPDGKSVPSQVRPQWQFDQGTNRMIVANNLFQVIN